MKKEAFYDIERDGITQGLLTIWRTCRESARLFLQGYSQKNNNSMGTTFGTIGHGINEKVYGAMQKGKLTDIPSAGLIKKYTKEVEKIWQEENPRASKEAIEQKEFALLLAETVMPLYFEYWHKDIKKMNWIGVEQEFDIPYTLKDGRKTRLRGKMDGVYKNNGVWLFETKCKSKISEGTLVDVLPLDFQNNFYLSAINKLLNVQPKGIKYNIIRRTLMEPKKNETLPNFAKRVVLDIKKRPEFYFIRFELATDSSDLKKFNKELENQIKEFYDWHQGILSHYPNPSQCETKYGRCWALGICAGNNLHQYEKRKKVFRELEDY
jgi:hypothetical protein